MVELDVENSMSLTANLKEEKTCEVYFYSFFFWCSFEVQSLECTSVWVSQTIKFEVHLLYSQ